MMEEINRLITPTVLNRLAEQIHASRNVVLFTSDFSGMTARGFQQSMVVMGKLVLIVTDAQNIPGYLQDLTEQDLLLTVSVTGNFATVMEPLVRKTAACKVLITVNHDRCFWAMYDQVIYLSEKDNANARTVYSQYGTNYFFDILYSCYVQKYLDNGRQQGPFSEPSLSENTKNRVQKRLE